MWKIPNKNVKLFYIYTSTVFVLYVSGTMPKKTKMSSTSWKLVLGYY